MRAKGVIWSTASWHRGRVLRIGISRARTLSNEVRLPELTRPS